MAVLKNIKKFIMQCFPFIHSIHLYLWKCKMKQKQKHDLKVFLMNGNAAIEALHQALYTTGNTFFVDAGTLLGIYRYGALIKNDMDVDSSINIKSQYDVYRIRQTLISYGFEHRIIFSTPEHGVIEDTFDYHGVHVDLCYYVTDGDKDLFFVLYDDDNKIIKLTHSHIEKTVTKQFNNMQVSIPVNSDLYLLERYGASWKIPDPNFKYWEGPNVTRLEGHGLCEFIDNKR